MRSILPFLLLGAIASGAAGAQTRPDDVARGDSLMAAFETSAAVETYRSGLEREPDDVALLWRTARALANLAEETPGLEGDEARYEEAVRLARKAVEAGPGVARAHGTLAGALGKLALFRGGRRKVELAREVHAEAERAIALDPSDFVGFAVLGVWHREVATLNPVLGAIAGVFLGGLPDASLDRSRSILARAVRLAPERISPRVELGRTLVAMDRPAAARAELRRALDLQPRERLDQVLQDRARELLRELEGT